jgi:hypothetical protein
MACVDGRVRRHGDGVAGDRRSLRRLLFFSELCARVQHQLPLPRGAARAERSPGWDMIEVVDAHAARHALAAGRLTCPSCDGSLRPWGRTRARTVAGHRGTATVRLDRARCRSCRATHVVLPADLVAGRSYPIALIGAALAAAGQGAGSGAVAAQLGVPAGTVRSWLRRARNNAEALYRFSVQTVVALEPDLLPTTPRATTLGNALDALAAAALATIRRFTPDQPARLWPMINMLTRGQLLAPAFSP